MFCTNCGTKLEEGALFCTRCGTKINHVSNTVMQPNITEQQIPVINTEVPKKKKTVVFAVIFAVLFFGMAMVGLGAGALFYMNQSLNQQKETISAAIGGFELPQYNEKKETVISEWEELNSFEISRKKELIETLEEITKNAESDKKTLGDYEKTYSDIESRKEEYLFVEDFTTFDDYLKEFQTAINSGDLESAKGYAEQAESMADALSEQNAESAQAVYDSYADVDMSIADKAEKEAYDEQLQKIDELFENEDMESLQTAFEELREIVTPYMEADNPLDVSVQQIDVSEFPNVKVYTRLENKNTGEVPKDLEQALFFVKKKDANGDYIKQEVAKASQLNEMESLNINIVADVSGSMEGSYINDAKEIMSNFVSSVQFDAGDMVELTSFSSGVKIEQEFCSDADILNDNIDNLVTDDMTSLYDALYTSVIRVATQPGAKCVIAFTDGYDNYSNCTYEEVIDAAKRYHVPIFIIGIGDVDEYAVDSIASQTGGVYYNTTDIASMDKIYEEIYRAEKELYLIEYTDDESGDFMKETDILVGYLSQEYGGNDEFSYMPNMLRSVDDSAFYAEGPEFVVESYMEGFDDAMTHSDFSYISDYLLKDSNIYNSQKKYVTRDIKETLYSYEIVDVSYDSAEECIVTTRETFYVQIPDEPLQMLTQECQYIVIKDNEEWKLSDFAAPVEVLYRINQ